MHNEFENEEDDWRPDKCKLRRWLEKGLGIAAVAVAFSLIGLLCVRLVLSKPPSSMKTMVWTESAIAAYQSEGESFSVTFYPSTDSFSKDGLFSISHITYIESIGQFQATVRYNERSFNYIREDYGLSSLPEGEAFVFMLRDSKGNVYKDYTFTSARKGGYGYRHVVFDGVGMEDVTRLTLEIYYSGDVKEGVNPRAELYMYKTDYAAQPYDFPAPPKA